jgi:hypothetical protein
MMDYLETSGNLRKQAAAVSAGFQQVSGVFFINKEN